MKNPLRRIVVGVATLQEEDQALAPAIKLAAATGATLHVVHAVEGPEEGVRGREGLGRGRIHRRYLAEARKALEEQVQRHASGTGLARIRCSAFFGGASEILHGTAEHVDADLLIVGATRRGTLARTILGTTAQRVLQGASRPILVLRAPLGYPVHRVLLTTDLSRLSEAVHERGIELVRELFPRDTPRFRSIFVEGYPAWEEPERLAAEAYLFLSEFLRECRPPNLSVEPEVRMGDAAKEIVAETLDWFADLLVLGTHGRTGASRALLGSVAEAVLRTAVCSVLVIPAGAVREARAGVAVAEAGAGVVLT